MEFNSKKIQAQFNTLVYSFNVLELDIIQQMIDCYFNIDCYCWNVNDEEIIKEQAIKESEAYLKDTETSLYTSGDYCEFDTYTNWKQKQNK